MQADFILYNANIHTLDPSTPRAQAIAIAGHRIFALGNDAAMRELLAPEGQAIDLRGRTVVPAFTDAHLHLMSYGLSLKRVDLAGVLTLAEALARVAARVQGTPVGGWVRGRGWAQDSTSRPPTETRGDNRRPSSVARRIGAPRVHVKTGMRPTAVNPWS